MTRKEWDEELAKPCWLWKATRKNNGYGVMHQGGRLLHAHRVIYEMMRGPIPAGLVLDHICRQRGCVNPGHLRAVTNHENMLAPGSRNFIVAHIAKTHCPKGHPYSEDNTRHRPRQGRLCRTCHRNRESIRRAVRRAGVGAA